MNGVKTLSARRDTVTVRGKPCQVPFPGCAERRETAETVVSPLFPVSYSLFPIPCSLFPIPCFLFPIRSSLFPAPYSLFPISYSLFFPLAPSSNAREPDPRFADLSSK
jgi:hypothetical protein